MRTQGLFVCLCAAVIVFVISQEHREASDAALSGSQTEHRNGSFGMESSFRKRRQEPHAPPLATVVPSQVRTTGAEGEPLLDALKKYPQLKAYREMTRKALMTKREAQALADMLSNVRRLEEAKAALLDPQETTLRDGDEMARMLWVRFLRSAMAWDGNPSLREALAASRDVLLADNLRPALPKDLKKSLAGDKLELFMTIHNRHPQTARWIEAEARGDHPSRKLIAFAKQRQAFAAQQTD